MATLTETRGTAEFIISEAPACRSRDAGSVAGGSAPGLASGTIVGRAGDVDEGNWTSRIIGTGDGAITFDATPNGVGFMPGLWNVRLVGAGATAAFEVFNPRGEYVGPGAVGSAFDGPINFTIADGAANYAIGDVVEINVPATTYGAHDPTSITGLATPAGILYEAAVGTVDRTVIVRDAEVNSNHLTYFDSATDAEKATVNAQLAHLGIIVR